ncbi:MAG: diguanylate cyclase [Pseudomonadota bacterium]
MFLHYSSLTLLALAMAVFAWMAVTTLKQAREGVAWSLGIYFVLVLPGIGGAALQVVADDATTLAVAKVMMFFCRAGIPVALIALVFDMMGRPFRPRSLVLLSVIPVCTMLLALTNSAHGLLWSPQLDDGSGQLLVHPAWGPWYRFVHAPYSYLLLGSMMGIFFLRLSAVSAPQRRSMVLFLIISLGPMLTGLLHSFGIHLDRLWLPALSVSLTAPLFLWIINDLRDHRFRPVSYRELIEQIDDPVIGIDLADRVVSINHAASALFGMDRAALLGRPLPSESPVTIALASSLATGKPLRHDERWFDVRKSDVLADDGSPRGQTLICRDVTAENAAQEALATGEQLMRTIVEHASYGIVRLRRDWPAADGEPVAYRCVFANAAAAGWARVDADSLAGKDAGEILSLVLAGWRGDEATLARQIFSAAADGQVVSEDVELSSDRSKSWLRLEAEPVDNDLVLTLTDISGLMRRQLAAERKANSDYLTGILSRHGFEQAAQRVIESEAGGLVLFIDLNGFKQVNDQFGHSVGDRLLQIVSGRLVDTCRSQDLVGRFGGDEFVVLAAGLTPDTEQNLVDRVTDTLSEAYELDDQRVTCSASIGRARFPEHGETLESLLSHADRDMYRAKRAGAGGVVLTTEKRRA